MYLLIGGLSAFLTGLGLPSFVFLLGDIIDAFGPTTDAEETLVTIKRICVYFLYIGCAILLFSYAFYTLLILFSERVAKRTRLAYIKHILSFDAAWFDSNNF